MTFSRRALLGARVAWGLAGCPRRTPAGPPVRDELRLSVVTDAHAHVFNDLDTYWSPETSWFGVQVPPTGTIIEVIAEKAQGDFMQVHVRPAK